MKYLKLTYTLRENLKAVLMILVAVLLVGWLHTTSAAQSNKSLVKQPNNPTVYWYQNGRYYPIVSGAILDTMRNNNIPGWSSISTLNVSTTPRGGNFISTDGSSDGLLINNVSNNAVYFITNGRREFISAQTFSQRGYDFNNVIDVPQAIINMFTDAPSPDFSISAVGLHNDSSNPLTRGDSTVYNITISSFNNFSSSVSLEAINLPPGFAGGTGWSPQSVTPSPNSSTSSQFTLRTNNSTQTGTFNITLRGTGGGITRETVVRLTIRSIPTDLTIHAAIGGNFSAGQSGIQVPVTVMRSGEPLPESGVYVSARLYFSSGSNFNQSTSTQMWESNGSTPDFPVSALNSNGSRTVTATIRIPTVTTSGTHYIHAVVDPTNYYQNEGNESNNVSSYSISVSATVPTITSITPSPVQINTPTVLTVNGTNFQNGFTAVVTARGTPYSIANAGLFFVNSNQVRVQVTMGGVPPYIAELAITNPQGGTSAKAPFSVDQSSSSSIRIDSISPQVPTRNADNDQPIRVNGKGFKPNLRLEVGFLNGNVLIDSPIQLQEITDTSLVANLRLGNAGRYYLKVINSDNAQSNTFFFDAVEPPADAPTIQLSPTITYVSESTGVSGGNYSRGGQVTFTVEHNNSTIHSEERQADEQGNVVMFLYSIAANAPTGTYYLQLTDVNTSRSSMKVLLDVRGERTACTPQSGDRMDYDAETIHVTVPDGTIIRAGDTFKKIWKLRNVGSTTWANYRLAAIVGDLTINGRTIRSQNFAAQNFINLDNIVSCESRDLPPITMTAPTQHGTYYSYWQLVNSAGAPFGDRIYVKFVVGETPDEQADYGSADGEQGTADSPGALSGRDADSVNTAIGNYVYGRTDLRVPGRGLDFEFRRTYNSLDVTQSPLGRGWSHSYHIYVTPEGSDISAVHYSDGKVLRFRQTAGIYQSITPGYYDKLTRNIDGTWTLKKTDLRVYAFDNNGRLTSIRDRNGNTIRITRNGAGNVEQVTDTVGRTFAFSYNGNLLSSVRDPLGRTIEFTYDDRTGNLAAARDARTNQTTYTYDDSNRLARITDPRGKTVVALTYYLSGRVETQKNGRDKMHRFAYDAAEKSTTVTDPRLKVGKHVHDSLFSLQNALDKNEGNAQGGMQFRTTLNNRTEIIDARQKAYSFKYDNYGNVIRTQDPLPERNTRKIEFDYQHNEPAKITDENNQATQMIYDSSGNLAGVTDARNFSTTTQYNVNGQPTLTTDANGNQTSYTYDASGNLQTVTDALTNRTTYGYDSIGRRVSETNARGKTTTYTYDENDNLKTTTDPLNNTVTNEYDGNNNLTSVHDARGNRTRYEYDANNMLVKEIDARDFFIEHTYDELNRRISTKDKRGKLTMVEYDNEGRMLSTTDALNNKTSYEYDLNGNRTAMIDASGRRTSYKYDELNRVKEVSDSIGNKTAKAYDKVGRLESETDARSNPTTFIYDEVGNLKQVTDAENGTAKYEYDANRNRTTQIDPNNQTSRTTYDKLNRVESTQDPLGNRYIFTYDQVGNRLSQTDANGKTTGYEYDNANRLTKINYQDGSTVIFEYDQNGNRTRMIDSLGISAFAYDELNRITSYTNAYGKTIGYAYDANGNITRLIYPDGKEVAYSYDEANRLTTFSDWLNKATGYEYDASGLLKKVTYPNGTTATYTYDGAGRLTNKTDDPAISSLAFQLDPNGNRTQADTRQPLPTLLSNTTQNYSYDTANRITSAGGATFGFDRNGNMTSRTESGATTNYAYDFEDRLINVGATTRYFYDGAGTRLGKTENGAGLRYVVDTNRELSQVLCETNESGAITSYYVYGLGLAYKVAPDGKHYYYHFDAIGSTVAMTDDARTIINGYAYDPFGKVTNSIEGVANPFQFVGQFGLINDGSDLVYVRSRYYSPSLGRFISKDSFMGEAKDLQSINQYVYSLNNPVLRVDVNGNYSTKDALQDLISVLKDYGLGVSQDSLLAVAKGFLITYRSGFRQSSYFLGGAKGSLKVSTPGNLRSNGILTLASFAATKLLDKIEGPRKEVPVLSSGLPIPFLNNNPWTAALNLAVGKIFFRYGEAGEKIDAKGNIYDSKGKRIGNLNDYKTTGKGLR